MKGLGKIIRGYVGQPFNECNCVQLIYKVLKDAGIILHSSYMGYNINNYMEYWIINREMMSDVLINWIGSIGTKVNVKYLKVGDILVLKWQDQVFPAIYAGGNKVVHSIMERGVIVTTLNKRLTPIIARRAF